MRGQRRRKFPSSKLGRMSNDRCNMRDFRRYLYIPAISLLFIGILSAVPANAQGPLGEILRRMDEHNKNLSSLKSNITMVKSDAALGDAGTDTTQGTVNYIPKAGKRLRYIRVDWVKPAENMIIVGDEYLIVRPTLSQAYKGNTNTATKQNSKVAGPLAFLSMSKEQLKANYSIIFVAEEQIAGGVRTWHLQLTPKAADKYKQADLWVDGDGMPRQARVTAANNDTTTILLTNISKNVKIDASIFSLKVPDGVKVIKS